MVYRFVPLTEEFDVGAFDCGEPSYNEWLTNSADRAQRAGTAKVYLLISEESTGRTRVVGYFAICPTAVTRADLPKAVGGGAPDPVPGYLLAKLALDQSLRGDQTSMWGTQLLLEALRRIVAAASISSGRIIIVDAGAEGLLSWYETHSFLPTGVDPLRLYMKVATARRLIEQYDKR